MEYLDALNFHDGNSNMKKDARFYHFYLIMHVSIIFIHNSLFRWLHFRLKKHMLHVILEYLIKGTNR